MTRHKNPMSKAPASKGASGDFGTVNETAPTSENSWSSKFARAGGTGYLADTYPLAVGEVHELPATSVSAARY
ncbi:hypothetical protein ATY78_04885 [Rhizobium sp. R635]|nr:hypothetical protein ATY78_04885 [Rhizobium sp. R635]